VLILIIENVHTHKIEVKFRMPWGDRTGPWGLGPMTGRAAGYCAGYPVPGYMNSMPGFGWGFGFGRGWGRGRGFGFGRGWGRRFGRGFRRWAWAYPQYGYGQPYAAYGPGYMHRSPYTTYGWGYWDPWSAYAMPRYSYSPEAYPYWYPPVPYMGYR